MQLPSFLYFDLGNVLLKFDHHLAARQMAQVTGVSEERVWNLVFASDLELRYEAGELDDRQFYEVFCAETDSRPDMDALLYAASAIFTPNASMFPVVSALHDAGNRMGILSNTCGGHWRYCTDGRYGLLSQAFEVYALSYELKACKPDPRIYAGAAKLASVPPREIFFVDDIAGHVQAAREAGFDAVQYTTTAQFVEDLRQRGVQFNY